MARRDVDIKNLEVSVARVVGALRQSLLFIDIPPNCTDNLLDLIDSLEKFETWIYGPGRKTADFDYCVNQKRVLFDATDVAHHHLVGE